LFASSELKAAPAFVVAWVSKIGGVSNKLEIIRAAAQHDYPVTDTDDMLEEIERGIRNGRTSVILVDSNIPMYLVSTPDSVGSLSQAELLGQVSPQVTAQCILLISFSLKYARKHPLDPLALEGFARPHDLFPHSVH
jgi:hypothetical protein